MRSLTRFSIFVAQVVPADSRFVTQESFETIEESPFAFITRAQLLSNDDGRREGNVVAVKSASILPELSQEPHDIVKELRLLTSLSHPNVRSKSAPLHGDFMNDPLGY